MERTWKLNLRMFDGGAGAAGAAAGAAAGGSAEGSLGGNGTIVLEDGTQMDHRLAERMEKQRARQNRRNGTAAGNQGNGQAGDAARGGQVQGNGQAGEAQNAQAEMTPEQEFEELIKGKFAKQYQQRIQNTISDRFKNQADLQGQLDGLKPMLDALAKQHGIEAGNYEALSNAILDDDSLYEDEAEAAGMTVEAYKSYKQLKAHADEMDAREQKAQAEMGFRNHLQKLAQQGEALKATFPDFDLVRELGDERFRRLTSPEVGVSVEDAYYVIHRDELNPQIMAAGVQVARQRISQSIQANGARPVEGAAQGNSTAADVHIDPRRMTRAQREELKARARRGETVTL